MATTGEIVILPDGVHVIASGFTPNAVVGLDLRSRPAAPNPSTRGCTIAGQGNADGAGSLDYGPFPTSFLIPDEPRELTADLSLREELALRLSLPSA